MTPTPLRTGTPRATLAHMSNPLLTINEAADRLGMSRRSLYRLIETDQLPYVRGLTPGAPVRLRLEDIDQFIAERTTPVVASIADSTKAAS